MRYERAMEDQMALIDYLTTPQAKWHVSTFWQSATGAISGSNAATVRAALWLALDPHEASIGEDLGDGIRSVEVYRKNLTAGQLAEKFTDKVRSALLKADPFFVTSAMMSYWQGLLADHDLTEIIQEQMLLTPNGIATFESPLYVVDDYAIDQGDENPHMTAVSHVVWFLHPRDRSRVVTVWYADLDHPPTATALWHNWKDAERFATPEIEAARERAGWEAQEVWRQDIRTNTGRFFIDTFSTMPFGSKSEAALRSPANRNFCLLMMLMGQPVASGLGVGVRDRWLRKAAKRKGLSDEVNIIYLRREVSRNPDLKAALETGRKIGVRHHVRSHWRRYWVTSAEGGKRREWRKVREHMRGPETGPTRIKDDLFVLKR